MKIGIIGGSGFYSLSALKDAKTMVQQTPFGGVTVTVGHVGEHTILFVPRHGAGHVHPPESVSHHAHIFAFKVLGVSRILAVTAVGSLKEDHRPGDILLVDQYFDRLKDNYTFFDQGIAVHVPFGDPVCNTWRAFVAQHAQVACDAAGVKAIERGTYVCMNGPAFSTRAESQFYRSLGFDVIGMTSLPEAKLAREAELCYTAMSLVTDYDCWHQSEESVTADAVVAQMHRNIAVATATIEGLLKNLDQAPECTCGCGSALKGAIMTKKEMISGHILANLDPIIGKHL